MGWFTRLAPPSVTMTARMYGGINLYHFTGGPCAELVALATARAGGVRALDAIVAVADRGRGVIGPCGRDRQILFDYHRDIRVLVPTPEGVRSVGIVSLLPLPTAWSPQPGEVHDLASDP
jgi:cytidine deaminase